MTPQSIRRTALAGGLFYLLTFASSLPAAFLQQAALADGSYVAGPGMDTQLALSGLLDVVTALAGIGLAVALFSVVKRQHEGLALGFVTTRLFEAAMLGVGALMVISLVTVRQAAAAGDASGFVPVGTALVAIRYWTAVIGPGMASLNALMLGTALFRARLIPRAIPALGLVGAPLFITFIAGTILGVAGPGTPFHAIAVAPFFFWELALGLWLVFKGFRPQAPIMLAAAGYPPVPALAPTSSGAVATKAGAA